MAKTAPRAADYILPLYMSGLSGRMIKLPPPKGKRREILLISGQHTSLERIAGMAEYLNRFGGVTSPDLPGFGGMQPLYKIDESPDLDTMAAYLAAFIKFRYRRGRFTIMAVSFGFAVVTRMLQLHPEISARVDLLVSIAGISHHQDFRWSRHNIIVMKYITGLLTFAPTSALARLIFIRGPLIRLLYRIAERKHPKLKGLPDEDRRSRIDFEIGLWKQNDFRTWMSTCWTMFCLDLSGRHIPLKVHHVTIENDHYFNNVSVEQHMRQIYQDVEMIKTKLPAHAPTVLATTKDVEPFVPPRVRQLLGRKV
jgi:pimeloyl-ACP methyl ester carboxylesterase